VIIPAVARRFDSGSGFMSDLIKQHEPDAETAARVKLKIVADELRKMDKEFLADWVQEVYEFLLKRKG
jgi:hypothetical protein